MKFKIEKREKGLSEKIQHKIDFLTKPIGALGKLEKIAKHISEIQNTLEPKLEKPTIVVVAADHGIAKEGVSPYPQEVTYQMVLNFLNGGAGINVFARQHQIEVKVVDAGVNFDFLNQDELIDAKVSKGTKNILLEPAMSMQQCEIAISKGAEIVSELGKAGCNVIGFGEMGIGNTSSAALILSEIANLPIEDCVGRGAGLDDEGLKRKNKLLTEIKSKHKISNSIEVLQKFGGFEIAEICGGMLKAAEMKMIILVDGFIATSAFLIAHSLYPDIIDYSIFCHKSNEHAHKEMFRFLGAEPLLDLGLRLGEGTGAAIAYPIIESAVKMINEMASFESANVSNKID